MCKMTIPRHVSFIFHSCMSFMYFQVDNSLTTEIRTKLQIQKKDDLKAFLESHCKIRQYMFSVMKCREPTCPICKPPRLPEEIFADLHHLPDPVPDGNRYQSFQVLYGKVCLL